MTLGWSTVCSPKAWGGLGTRPPESQNRSLLARLGWNLLSNKNILWVSALESKYLHRTEFLISNIPPNA
jgi:hypothetical protein